MRSDIGGGRGGGKILIGLETLCFEPELLAIRKTRSCTLSHPQQATGLSAGRQTITREEKKCTKKGQGLELTC